MKYEVRGLRGEAVVSVTIDAPSLAQARQLAAEQKLDVLSVRASLGVGRVWARRFNLHLFSEELAELLDAGLSVVEALDTLAERQSRLEGRNLYGELVAQLRQGKTFSTALEQMPEVFPALYVGVIRAAERTSDLKGALHRYLDYSGRLDSLKGKIISALIYPTILVVVGGAVVLFLLGFVVPRFATVYRGTPQGLPLLSQWLLDWGAFVAVHKASIAVTIIAAMALTISWSMRAMKTGALERLVGKLPGLKGRINLFRLSRLYLTLGTLMNGGMPVVTALTLAEGVVGPRHAPRLALAANELKQGSPLSAALEAQSFTTPVSLRLLRAAEGTGRMGEVLVRAGQYHDHELARWVDRFSKVFEPVLMALIGLLVGAVVILLYMPIFDLAGSIR